MNLNVQYNKSVQPARAEYYKIARLGRAESDSFVQIVQEDQRTGLYEKAQRTAAEDVLIAHLAWCRLAQTH